MRFVALALFSVVLVLIQVLIGGAGLVYALPSLLLLGVTGLVLVGVSPEKSSNGMTFWSGIAALGLAGFVMGRSYFSPVDYLARWDLFLALGCLVAYLMTSYYFVRAGDRLVLIGVLGTLVLAHVLIGAIQFKQMDNFMLIPWLRRSNWDWRASGFYIYPNHLAGLLEMLCFMTLSVACWGRVSNWVRILAGYCALMCLLGVALTGSRGGYLSTLFGLLLFGVLSFWVIRRVRPDRQWPVTLAALCGAGLLVGGALFFMYKSSLISERVDTVYDPANMRIFMWKSALEQFKLSPLLGTGSGTFVYYARQFRAPEVQQDPIFVHNDYLHLLAEYGMIGAALGLAFLGMHLTAGWLGLRRIVNHKLRSEWQTSSNELALVLGALCGIGALLVHSVVDFNFHLPANALIGAVFLGILAKSSVDLKRSGEKTSKYRGWLAWGVPLGGLGLLILGCPLWPGEYRGELARRALRDREFGRAQGLALEALEVEKKNPNIYYHLGEARHYLTEKEPDGVLRASLHEQAAEAYEEGLKLFPRDTRLLLKLGMTLDLAGRFAEADEVYQRAIDGDPNFGNVYAYYGLHFKLMRNFPDAELYLLKANQLHETDLSGPALREIEKFKASDFGKQVLDPEYLKRGVEEVAPPSVEKP